MSTAITRLQAITQVSKPAAAILPRTSAAHVVPRCHGAPKLTSLATVAAAAGDAASTSGQLASATRPVLTASEQGVSLTLAAVGLNAAVFAAAQADPTLFTKLCNCSYTVLEGSDFGRLVLSAAMHANLGHLTATSAGLLAAGPAAEKCFGRANAAAIYFLSAVAGSIASLAAAGDHATVGATAAVAGLAGAAAAAQVRSGAFEKAAAVLLGVVALHVAASTAGGDFVTIAGTGSGLAAGALLGMGLPATAAAPEGIPAVVVFSAAAVAEGAGLLWLLQTNVW